jgi:hypothetical protein
LLHNPVVIGGSWFNSDQKLVALLGLQGKATAVKVKESSIIIVKQRVPNLEEILDAILAKKKLKDIRQRQSSELFHYKYILPVPVSLVRAFAELSSFDPDSVAQAMLSAMTHSGTKERQSVDDSSSDSSSSQSSTFETSPSK